MNSNGGCSVEEMLAYRYGVYDLLRRIFLWQFPLELFTELVKASRGGQDNELSVRPLEAPFRACLGSLQMDSLERSYRDLHIEYTRLFVGPQHLPAPPYESVYRNPERLMMQDETIDVRAIYSRNGFRVARIGQEPDDTIGIELEFMCAMSKSSTDAFAAKDNPKLLQLVSTQKQFCDDHLFKWVPKFCKDILDNSTSEFWKSVATFTSNFLEEDFATLNAFSSQLEGAARSISGESDRSGV